MNFTDRTNAIGTLLRETILPRYRRPEHLDDTAARAEAADMVADLNAEWPLMSDEAFRDTGERFARELRKISTSRSWPSIGHMLRALEAATKAAPMSERTVAGSFFDPEDAKQMQLVKWANGEADCPSCFITPGRLLAIAERGKIERADIGKMLRYAEVNQGVYRDRGAQL